MTKGRSSFARMNESYDIKRKNEEGEMFENKHSFKGDVSPNGKE